MINVGSTTKALLLSALALGFLQLPAAGQQRHDVMAGTTSSASSLYAYYAALAKAASDHGVPVRVTVVETGGTEENIRRMVRGEFEIGLIVQRSLADAYEGKGEFWEGRPQTDLRLLNLTYIAPQAFVVRKDSGVTTMAGLNGEPWSPGHQGSGSENVTLQILDALGVEPRLFRGALTDIVRATKNGEIIGFSKGLPGYRLDATMLDLQASHPFELIGFTAEEQETLREKMPELPLIDVPGSLAQTEADIVSWAFLVGTAVNASVPDDVAYELAKLADEAREEIGESFAPAAETDTVQLTLERATVPLHPGAARYYREKGHEVPDHLVP